MNTSWTNCSRQLDDALWENQTTSVYGKACHLSIEIENKALWAFKKPKF